MELVHRLPGGPDGLEAAITPSRCDSTHLDEHRIAATSCQRGILGQAVLQRFGDKPAAETTAHSTSGWRMSLCAPLMGDWLALITALASSA